MKIAFTKMHGAGNDFIVIDATKGAMNLSPAQWRALADRRFGIGADQILIVEQSSTPEVDFRYRIFNADGGEVEQCGNGARAFVKFVVDKKLTSKRCITVQTQSGIIEPKLEADGQITVNMGRPILETNQVPFVTTGLTERIEGKETLWPLEIDHHTLWCSVLSMGNPHAVHIVPNIDTAAVSKEGPLIERHPRFPNRVNAGFMHIMDRHHIKLRVFERGTGETLACGTGACAAAVSGIRRNLLDSPVSVETRGGQLTIAWTGEAAPVYLTGPAVSVFDGEIDI